MTIKEESYMKVFFDRVRKKQSKEVKHTKAEKSKNGKILEVVKNFHHITKKK